MNDLLHIRSSKYERDLNTQNTVAEIQKLIKAQFSSSWPRLHRNNPIENFSNTFSLAHDCSDLITTTLNTREAWLHGNDAKFMLSDFYTPVIGEDIADMIVSDNDNNECGNELDEDMDSDDDINL